MKIGSGLNKQIFLALAIVGLFPLLVMAFQNHYFARKVLENTEKKHLSFALRSRLLWLRTWVSHTRRDFYQVAFNGSDRKELSEEETYLLSAKKLFKGHLTYQSISLYRPDWSPIICYPEGFREDVPTPSETYQKKLQNFGELFVVGDEYRSADNEVILPVGQGLLNRKGESGAFLIAEINLTRSLERILGDTSDLNDGGRYILASTDGKILYKSPPPNQTSTSDYCADNMLPPEVLSSPPWTVRKLTNCSQNEVYSINASIPEFDWLLIGQFDTNSGLHEFEDYVSYGLITALITLMVLILLARNLSQRLSSPLDELTRVARRISAGRHNERLPAFKEPYVQEVGEAFNAMMDALEKQQQSIIQSTSLSTVGRMSSSLVHEMRNPLSSIKINIQALARKVKDDESYSEMATIGLRQVDRLERMFDDLLQFSKPMVIHKKPITFIELVGEVVMTLKSESDKKNIELKVEDKLIDLPFLADKENSSRALGNLIDNAIGWSPVGSVVTISGKRLGENTIIRVTDQGPGLRPEQMEKVFQPFFTTREKGTGLGLANVKKIMNYQGGSVLAENNPDTGASFSLIFKD